MIIKFVKKRINIYLYNIFNNIDIFAIITQTKHVFIINKKIMRRK